MDDLISRQEAIDAIEDYLDEYSGLDEEGYYGEKWCAMAEARMVIENLPSAQPEKRTEKRTETYACDLIDREAAVDAIYHHLPSVSRTRARTMLHEVPSAQPEIIRCKDCKHKHLENMVWTCPFGLPGGENFFCGYGAEPYKGEQE